MAPFADPAAAASSSAISFTKFQILRATAPSQPKFSWKAGKNAPTKFSIWYWNVRTGAYTLIRDNVPIKGFAGTSEFRCTTDPLKGVVGTYQIQFFAAPSTPGYPKHKYASSEKFELKASDFET